MPDVPVVLTFTIMLDPNFGVLCVLRAAGGDELPGNLVAGPPWNVQDGGVGAVPLQLRPGSVVRVIAPSRSLAIIGSEVRAEADRKLAALGLKVSFGEHVRDAVDFSWSSVRVRLGG